MQFVGYEGGTKGYRFWNGSSPGKKITVSRSVKFENNTHWDRIHANTEVFITPSVPRVKNESDVIEVLDDANVKESLEQSEEINSHDLWTTNSDLVFKSEKEDDEPCQEEIRDVEENKYEIPRRSTRITKGIPPAKYQVTQIGSIEWKDPTSYAEALRRPKNERDCWVKAMKKEFDSLHSLNVLEQADVPKDVKVIGCKWVFKRKTQVDGSLLYKARLVAQGFGQIYNQNYDEVYAPTIRPETIRTALGIGVQRKYVIRHFDIATAYLNAELTDNVYMRAIPGFEKDTPTGVYRLRKALYGLKQAARCWNQCIDEKLKSLGFERSSVDTCLYKKGKESRKQTFVLVFVDDLLILAPSGKDVEQVFKGLNSSMTVKDLGEVRKYLGVNVTRTENDICLDQKDKVFELLERTRLTLCKTVATPMVPDFLKLEKGEMFVNQTLFRSVVGSLLYLANWTRPDIAYATNVLSRRVNEPTLTDWQAVKRVLRYLKGTCDKKLKICPKESGMKGFADASFGDNEQNLSCSGYLISFNGIQVTWKSRKQSHVCLSTAEAEFSALSDCCTELEWIKALVNEFQSFEDKISLFTDSQSCIAISNSEGLKQRTKYIGVRYQNVRKLVQDGFINPVYVQSDENMADMFTKALTNYKLNIFCEKILLI